MRNILFVLFFTIFLTPGFSQQPAFTWANMCGNPPNTSDTKSCLASGPYGSIYMAAEFLDTVQFGEKMLVSSGGTDIYLVKFFEDGTPVWSIKLGGADFDYVQKIVVDSEGDILMTGYFYGTTQIGPDEYTSFGSQDLFIAKFNSDGAFLWSYHAGGTMADYIPGLTADGDKNIVITGYYYDAIAFGDTTISSSGSSDVFLAKFNPAGHLLWLTQAGGSSSDQSRSASCDPDGNILLSSSFYYDFTIGDTTLITQNPVGIAIIKYSPDGAPVSLFQLDGTYLTPEVYTAAGQEGAFYLSGNFSEEIVFGNKAFDAGEFNQDVFIAKYDASCSLLWAKHAHSFASDQVVALVTDQDDNVYITGHYLDSLYIDNLKLRYTMCCGSREVFIISLEPGGDVEWGEQISGTRANIQSLALTSQDKLLFSGLFSEEITMGPLKLTNFDGFRNYITCLDTETVTYIPHQNPIGNFRIYPNPVNDYLRFSTDVEGIAMRFMICNSGGSVVSRGIVIPGNTISTITLSPGRYILQLTELETGKKLSGQFVKY
jgi:hypothetical protein